MLELSISDFVLNLEGAQFILIGKLSMNLCTVSHGPIVIIMLNVDAPRRLIMTSGAKLLSVGEISHGCGTSSFLLF